MLDPLKHFRNYDSLHSLPLKSFYGQERNLIPSRHLLFVFYFSSSHKSLVSPLLKHASFSMLQENEGVLVLTSRLDCGVGSSTGATAATTTRPAWTFLHALEERGLYQIVFLVMLRLATKQISV